MPERLDKIPFNRPFVAGRELLYLANAVLVEHRLSGGGTYGRLCAQWLEGRLRASKAFLTPSCTAALEMAALLCNIEPGDEVIMPSFTFSSTANAFVLRGAIPVFVDIRPDTLNIDESQIAAAVTTKTRAIVPVHYAGVSCDMHAIMKIARDHGLRVIEDAAQALLSPSGNGFAGTTGDIGCLSFHETKNVICGEGGAILVNDPALHERAEIIWEKGTNRAQMIRGEADKYTWLDIGSSYVANELAAAFLCAQFERADEIIARRQAIHDRYAAGLAELVPQIQFGHRQAGNAGNGHIFYLMTQTEATRTALLKYLVDRNIHAIFHYIPLHSAPAGRRYGRAHGTELPVTDRVASTLVRLPLFFGISNDEVDTVIHAIHTFFREHV